MGSDREALAAILDGHVGRGDLEGALAALDTWEAALGVLAEDAPERIDVVVNRALILARFHRLDEAERLAQPVVERGAGGSHLARAVGVLADCALARRHLDRAEALAMQARGLYEAAGDAAGAAATIGMLGVAAAERGEHRRARTLLRETAERLDLLGDRSRRARVLLRLAMAELGAHDLAAAERTGSEAGRELAAVGADAALPSAYALLAQVARDRGDDALAARRLEDAIAVNPGGAFGDVASARAGLAFLRGDLAAAARAWRAHLAGLAGEAPIAIVPAHLGLADIALEEGRTDEARAHLDAALGPLGDRRSGELAHPGSLAMWAAARDRRPDEWDRGYAMTRRAVADRGDCGARAERAALGAGRSWSEPPGDPVRAVRSLAVALDQAERLGNRRLEADAEAALAAWAGRAPIPVGAFDLHDEVGRGGFGVVHRAVRQADGQEAAVKVLTADAARDRRRVAAFEAEIRVVLRLDHPSLAPVWDYGACGRAAEIVSGGRLPAGSPFLAMPYARGGTLERWLGRLSFSSVRGVLAALLRGIAAAHASDVLHRDLKPANVLLAGDEPSEGVRIADFGLAASLHEEVRRERIAGTPAYMAPEQVAGRWRSFGPWTDLYALGCTAAALLSGEPPAMVGTHPWVVRPGAPRVAVPAGWDAWLAQAIDPDPAARFRHAADALQHLLALPEAAEDAPRRTPHPRPRVSSPTFTFTGTTSARPSPEPTEGSAGPERRGGGPHRSSGATRSWRCSRSRSTRPARRPTCASS